MSEKKENSALNRFLESTGLNRLPKNSSDSNQSNGESVDGQFQQELKTGFSNVLEITGLNKVPQRVKDGITGSFKKIATVSKMNLHDQPPPPPAGREAPKAGSEVAAQSVSSKQPQQSMQTDPNTLIRKLGQIETKAPRAGIDDPPSSGFSVKKGLAHKAKQFSEDGHGLTNLNRMVQQQDVKNRGKNPQVRHGQNHPNPAAKIAVPANAYQYRQNKYAFVKKFVKFMLFMAFCIFIGIQVLDYVSTLGVKKSPNVRLNK